MVSLKQFVQSLESSYENDEISNVVGWDFYMDMFKELARLKGVRPLETWNFHIVTVFKGERIVGLLFDKEDEIFLQEIIDSDPNLKNYCVVNGSNPFI